MTAPVPERNWEGLADAPYEHRTVGPHRAWCYEDREWCYSDDPCQCCDQTRVPERWKGERVGTVLDDLRAQVLAVDPVEWVLAGMDAPRIVLALLNGGKL